MAATLDARDYSDSELLDILHLDPGATAEDVRAVSDHFIDQFTKKGDRDMVDFYETAKSKLLSRQTAEWFKEEALQQTTNPVQQDKTTERAQKAPVFANDDVPMNREQLGVNNVVDIPVAQGTMNPTLRNVNSHFINLDSQFRQFSDPATDLSTSYTLDLSDTLNKVLNMRLYSVQIPYTWYTIDESYGNTCFWVVRRETDEAFLVSVTSGNYQGTEFAAELSRQFVDAGFVPPSSTTEAAAFNAINAKLTITLGNGWLDPNGDDVTADYYFLFFDPTKRRTCFRDCTTSSSVAQSQPFNNTLGWLMGFRQAVVPVEAVNAAPSVLNLLGSKYFILVLDDYNQNHVNNGLIGVGEMSRSFAMPSYYNAQQPYQCESASMLVGGANDGLETQVAQVVPSAPRTLTSAQIRTVNQIAQRRKQTVSYRAKAPANSDTFALIPLKVSGLATGSAYIDFSGSLQDSKRVYFGPVDVGRIKVQLLDDRGNVVNLHGADWSITLIAETLYQY
jgi:hypothetical protein